MLILFCAGVGKCWYWIKEGFTIARVQGWEGKMGDLYWNKMADEIVKQEFHSIGRGRQCYAFESEDGKYVIKIPRRDRYNLPFWLRALDLKALDSYREHRRVARFNCGRGLIESFHIAFADLKEETGIIAMWVPKMDVRELHIRDKLGRSYHLPFGKVGFILQHKKRLFRDVFAEAHKKGTVDQVFKGLMDLVEKRARKGILNKDGSFLRNFGFDENGAYQIDVGSFYKEAQLSDRDAYDKSIRNTMAPIREWAERINPDYLRMIDEKIVAILDTI